jgi:hypothetical protein
MLANPVVSPAAAALALVPPALARAAAILVFLLCVGVSTLHVLIVSESARRAGFTSRRRAVATVATGGLLALWLATAITIADGAHFPLDPDISRFGLTLAALLTPILVGLAAIFTSRTLGAINAATPPQWLIWAQGYRLAGALFLFPYLVYGVLPAAFAWPAAIGDMGTAALGIVVGRAVARKAPNARRWAVLWNVAGIADLIVAPTMALLTRANVATIYPLVLVPLFVGPPLAILVHVLSLRNLRVSGEARRAVGAGDELALARQM